MSFDILFDYKRPDEDESGAVVAGCTVIGNLKKRKDPSSSRYSDCHTIVVDFFE